MFNIEVLSKLMNTEPKQQTLFNNCDKRQMTKEAERRVMYE